MFASCVSFWSVKTKADLKANFLEFLIWVLRQCFVGLKKFQLNYNREIFSLVLAPTVVISKQNQRFHAKIPDPGGCFNDKANKLSSHFAGSLSTCAKIITFSSRRRVVLLMATKRPFFLSRSLPVPCVSVDGQKKANLISPAAFAASGSAKQCSILVRFCAPARRAACAVVVRGLFREHYFPFGPVRVSAEGASSGANRSARRGGCGAARSIPRRRRHPLHRLLLPCVSILTGRANTRSGRGRWVGEGVGSPLTRGERMPPHNSPFIARARHPVAQRAPNLQPNRLVTLARSSRCRR